jgi:hypothetical protein
MLERFKVFFSAARLAEVCFDRSGYWIRDFVHSEEDFAERPTSVTLPEPIVLHMQELRTLVDSELEAHADFFILESRQAATTTCGGQRKEELELEPDFEESAWVPDEFSEFAFPMETMTELATNEILLNTATMIFSSPPPQAAASMVSVDEILGDDGSASFHQYSHTIIDADLLSPTSEANVPLSPEVGDLLQLSPEMPEEAVSGVPGAPRRWRSAAADDSADRAKINLFKLAAGNEGDSSSTDLKPTNTTNSNVAAPQLPLAAGQAGFSTGQSPPDSVGQDANCTIF